MALDNSIIRVSVFVSVFLCPLPGVVATTIATGMAFSCALVTGGGMMCWGNNDVGMLGISCLGEGNLRNRPANVSLGPGACELCELPCSVVDSALRSGAKFQPKACGFETDHPRRTNAPFAIFGLNEARSVRRVYLRSIVSATAAGPGRSGHVP
jgi:hypothetical protein